MDSFKQSSESQTAPSDVMTHDAWVHTRETVTMLYLAICQIETSIVESNTSVQQLTDTFTRLAGQTLGSNVEKDSDGNPIWTTEEMRERINEAITAFQFYDRISQRLDHVSRGLERMTKIFSDLNSLNDIGSWEQIKEEVRESYSMECERAMFEKIVSGASVEEALATYRELLHKQDDQEDEDDIELF
ncbi:hypothetical protein [Aurantivibrio plasticivorans]